jgi:hypothetical protein
MATPPSVVAPALEPSEPPPSELFSCDGGGEADVDEQPDAGTLMARAMARTEIRAIFIQSSRSRK